MNVATLADVVAWGWDRTRLVKEIIDFRDECIEGLTPEGQPQPEEWGEICFAWPDTWRLLTDGPGRIAGYWHSLPLNTPALMLAKEGKLLSGMISRQMIRPLSAPGWYDFYVATVAVKREYRGIYTGVLLVHSLLDAATALARKGFLIREMCANFFTRDGQMLNDGMGLGLKYVVDHEVTGVIYSGRFTSLLQRQLALHGKNAPPLLGELMEYYRE